MLRYVSVVRFDVFNDVTGLNILDKKLGIHVGDDTECVTDLD